MRSLFRSSTTVPLAEQLRLLGDCGVRLRPGVTPQHIARLPERASLVKSGYVATLCALGAARIDTAGDTLYLSDDVWFFHAACIMGTHSYAHVIWRLAQLLPLEFPARDPADSIDLDNWRASVSFELDDARHHWTQRVLGNWLDETLFVRINQMIEAQDTADHGRQLKHLWQVPLPGDHRLIVAATPADGRRLAQVCGLALRAIV